jgi:hypothetical protein
MPPHEAAAVKTSKIRGIHFFRAEIYIGYTICG